MIRYYLKRIFDEQRPVKFIVSRILWKTGLCRLFRIKQPLYTLLFSPTSLSANMWVYPENFLHDESVLNGFIKEGDTVIDVGANIGSVSLAASAIVGAEGMIYSIEAHPRTYKYLCANIKKNKKGNIFSLNYAVGDKKDEVYFTNYTSDDMNCISDQNGISVPVNTLDALISTDRNIRLIKIDTEGYEIFVLRGAHAMLKKTDIVYLESYELNFNRYNYSTGDVLQLLGQEGFNIYKISNNMLLQLDQNYTSKKCENIVAIKSYISLENIVSGNNIT